METQVKFIAKDFSVDINLTHEWYWLPDPVLDHTGQHFKPLEAVLGTNTIRLAAVAQKQQVIFRYICTLN